MGNKFFQKTLILIFGSMLAAFLGKALGFDARQSLVTGIFSISILFMVMIIFEMSDYFEADPIPFIIAPVLATNIGSTGTVIGNPIGIFIAV